MPNVKIQERYGEREIVSFDAPWRREIYRPHGATLRWEREIEERHAATGPDDVSPAYGIYGGYDSRCGWCWQNTPHTCDEHKRKIGEP